MLTGIFWRLVFLLSIVPMAFFAIIGFILVGERAMELTAKWADCIMDKADG